MSPPAQRDTALREAAAWFARLRADAIDEGDDAAWRSWRDGNLMHRRAYDEIEQVWSALDGLDDGVGPPPSSMLRTTGQRRPVVMALGLTALAALISIQLL